MLLLQWYFCFFSLFYFCFSAFCPDPLPYPPSNIPTKSPLGSEETRLLDWNEVWLKVIDPPKMHDFKIHRKDFCAFRWYPSFCTINQWSSVGPQWNRLGPDLVHHLLMLHGRNITLRCTHRQRQPGTRERCNPNAVQSQPSFIINLQ